MRAVAHFLASLAMLGAALFASPVFAQTFPERGTASVLDNADVLDPATEAALSDKLDQFNRRTQRQFVVATIPSLEGYDIADYGYRLGRYWSLGDEERNDGVILLVAPNDRKVRIEVGYGLEPYLTDGYSTLIVQNTILPRFKEGDLPGGIVAGADEIIKQLELPAEEAARVAQEATAPAESDGIPFGMIIWIAFILFFFILPLMRGGKRGRRHNGTLTGSTIGDIVVWEAGKSILGGGSRGGGWGGGGGFGGGGGGFSGGGGSFGGGGASGGW
ncbi:TPM domain-containing protein [Tsuneonella amylolytica]|uniref:TPM domain-containing protein n=1 Tax=Tsuneonella amylolytica TaxID=2338327 RepID=UPI000EA8A3EA|nr:TPM domain-containing protein [Tsuneonella amylolytica]